MRQILADTAKPMEDISMDQLHQRIFQMVQEFEFGEQNQKQRIPKQFYHGTPDLWNTFDIDLDAGTCFLDQFGPIAYPDHAFFVTTRADDLTRYAFKSGDPGQYQKIGYVYEIEIDEDNLDNCHPIIPGITGDETDNGDFRVQDNYMQNEEKYYGRYAFTTAAIQNKSNWVNSYRDGTHHELQPNCKLKVVKVWRVTRGNHLAIIQDCQRFYTIGPPGKIKMYMELKCRPQACVSTVNVTFCQQNFTHHSKGNTTFYL